MFLILGTPECKYCLESKKLLDSLKIKYTYVDLSLELGDDWRSIFSELKNILKGQKTIPIIFQEKTPGSGTTPSGLTVKQLSDSGWNILGTFFELEDLVNDMDISICDEY